MEHRVIMDGYWSKDFLGLSEKRRKLNPKCANVYLFPDGTIVREEDKIIAAQRIWRERAYAPPGTLFEKRGFMYRKALERWELLQTKHVQS
jgi:hypothetical protein